MPSSPGERQLGQLEINNTLNHSQLCTAEIVSQSPQTQAPLCAETDGLNTAENVSCEVPGMMGLSWRRQGLSTGRAVKHHDALSSWSTNIENKVEGSWKGVYVCMESNVVLG